MFNTTILDVAIGLTFIYLLLSLMCTAANEIIELLLKKRAIDLERGIRELLVPNSDSGDEDIVQEFYNHPLINGLFEGTYQESGIATRRRWVKRTQLPSYIPARNFSLALMDLIRPGVGDGGAVVGPSGAADATAPSSAQPSPGPAPVVVNVSGVGAPLVVPPAPLPPNPSVVALRAALAAADPQITEQIKRGVIPLLDAAGNDVAKVRENIEAWYNASMDRVSSWYKRRAQVNILILGLFIAVTVNVDTITIAKRLSTDKALRESLVAASDAYAKANATASPAPKPSPATQTTSSESAASGAANATGKPVSGTNQGTAVASPSPSSVTATSPLPEQSVSPSTVPMVSPSAEPVVSPSAVVVVSPSGSPSISTAPKLPACVKDETSADCKRALSHENACRKPDSEACKSAEKLQKACENPNSAECKRGTDALIACEEPNSVECQSAKDLQQACEDPEAPKCKYLANLAQIQALGLPIGWETPGDPKRTWPGLNFVQAGGWLDQIYWHALGWILTALALSLGAPFWFDLLNKFIVIRSAVKPHEKSPEEGSKD
ncbi:MAG: hypothetical protein M3539_09790 [Acidobacteriota bacterium]|nr:hypothetical protein [Acidobacteriota bacterium]